MLDITVLIKRHLFSGSNNTVTIYRIVLRAHFYTPFGVVRHTRFCTAPKPPLCKGRWHGKAVTEGLCSRHLFYCSVSAKSKCSKTIPQSACSADSSLYTREPWALPRQRIKPKLRRRYTHDFISSCWPG